MNQIVRDKNHRATPSHNTVTLTESQHVRRRRRMFDGGTTVRNGQTTYVVGPMGWTLLDIIGHDIWALFLEIMIIFGQVCLKRRVQFKWRGKQKQKKIEECELQGVHVSKDMYMLFNVTRGHCGTGSNDV